MANLPQYGKMTAAWNVCFINTRRLAGETDFSKNFLEAFLARYGCNLPTTIHVRRSAILWIHFHSHFTHIQFKHVQNDFAGRIFEKAIQSPPPEILFLV